MRYRWSRGVWVEVESSEVQVVKWGVGLYFEAVVMHTLELIV